MTSKRLTRATRSGKLSSEQVARNRELRRRIREEFPPVPRAPMPESVSEALKQAIETSGLTVYEIAKRAKVSQIVISRFLSGARDIRLATADKLSRVLGLELVRASR